MGFRMLFWLLVTIHIDSGITIVSTDGVVGFTDEPGLVDVVNGFELGDAPSILAGVLGEGGVGLFWYKIMLAHRGLKHKEHAARKYELGL